jgi:proteic killer suppression protein
VIKSFRDRNAERLFNRLPTRRWRGIARQARRKLEILNAARSLNDLRVPPGSRLEALKGRRQGQHSIRINDQWRICFVWRGEDAYDVEITDYH